MRHKSNKKSKLMLYKNNMLNCSKYYTKTMDNVVQSPKLQTKLVLSNKITEKNKEVYTLWSIASEKPKTPNTNNITCFHILQQSKK